MALLVVGQDFGQLSRLPKSTPVPGGGQPPGNIQRPACAKGRTRQCGCRVLRSVNDSMRSLQPLGAVCIHRVPFELKI